MVSRDKYKIDFCTLIEDECTGWDCSQCSVAYEEKEDESKIYTCFDRITEVRGVVGHGNMINTIGKFSLGALQSLQDENVIANVKTPYNPILLRQYEQDLRKLRIHNRLCIPSQIYIKKDFPAAFVWGDIVYLIAPRIIEE